MRKKNKSYLALCLLKMYRVLMFWRLMYQCRYLLDFFGLNLRKAADGLRDLNAYHSVWDFCHRKKFGSERNTLDRLNSIKKI